MIGTITPLVQTAQSQRDRLIIGAFFVVYGVCGALGTAAMATSFRLLPVFAGVGGGGGIELSEGGSVLTLGVVAMTLLLLGLYHRAGLPMIDRQVPAGWRDRLGARCALLAYAFVLGTGVMTRINSPGVYLIPVLAAFAPDWGTALAASMIYGALRAATEAVTAIRLRVAYFESFEAAFGRVAGARVLALGVQALALALFVGAAVGAGVN